MGTYKIFPLWLCRVYADIGSFVYTNFSCDKSWYPVFSFLVQGEGRSILVDSGCSGKEMTEASTAKMPYEDVQSLEEALGKWGVSLEDVNDVIQTHLHSDHWLNARRLPHATFWVQEEELAFAMNPHPFFKRRFKPERYKGFTFKTVKGDTTFADGIDILFTPGHTAGTQSVKIHTDKGEVIIAGFCSVPENFYPTDKTMEAVPPGIHLDLLQSYDSAVRIRRSGAIILPLHDPNLVEKKSIP